MTSSEELLPVTQADRDAASQAYHAIAKGYMQVIGCAMEAGAADHAELVQLFARHRISHSLPGEVGTVSAVDAFEMGFSFGMAMRNLTTDGMRG